MGFGALLFGQITGHDSIRATERVFAHGDSEMQKIGFGPVRKSTLAEANHHRDLRVLEDLFALRFARAQAVAPGKTGFRFAGQVLAMDSTTIELCLAQPDRSGDELTTHGDGRGPTADSASNELGRTPQARIQY